MAKIVEKIAYRFARIITKSLWILLSPFPERRGRFFNKSIDSLQDLIYRLEK